MSAPSVSCRIHTCSCRSLHASYTHATHQYVTPQYKRLDCLFRPARAATRRPHSLGATAAAQEAESIASPVLPPISSEQQLDSEERWLADTIQAWQDDEWQVQQNHRDLGVAVGKAYRGVRSAGEDDVGTILLSIASDLEAFDFHDTFTGNFEVANKAIELLMSRDGQEVCCT